MRMKIMLRFVLLLVAFAGFVVIPGCEEQTKSPGIMQEGRVMDENRKLRKQFELCNQKLRELKESVAECRKKKADAQAHLKETLQQQTQDDKHLFEMISQASTELANLTIENTVLKAKVEELGAELAPNHN